MSKIQATNKMVINFNGDVGEESNELIHKLREHMESLPYEDYFESIDISFYENNRL